MTEQQAEYITKALELLNGEPAAEIHPPKTIRAIKDKGLTEYKVWGWVKISANFIHHIKKLKGAKLAIWQVVSLSIDESGECKLSIHEIAELAGYSYSETHESLKELDEMKYLATERDAGKKSMYSPNFAARGEAQPTDNPSRKTIGSNEIPLQSARVKIISDPSSPPLQKELPSIKSLKRVNNGVPPSFGLDWKVVAGQEITEQDIIAQSDNQRTDAANLIAMGTGINSIAIHNLAYAFMTVRQIVIPNGSAKGNRKAAEEMLKMKVAPVHVVEATKKLIEAGMTVTDLFSIKKTAIDLANKIVEPQRGSMIRTIGQ